MTDQHETAEEEVAFKDFWTARDEHQAAVKAKLEEVLAVIQEGIDANLYRDGITTKLDGTKTSTQHWISQLSTPSVPTDIMIPPQV